MQLKRISFKIELFSHESDSLPIIWQLSLYWNKQCSPNFRSWSFHGKCYCLIIIIDNTVPPPLKLPREQVYFLLSVNFRVSYFKPYAVFTFKIFLKLLQCQKIWAYSLLICMLDCIFKSKLIFMEFKITILKLYRLHSLGDYSLVFILPKTKNEEFSQFLPVMKECWYLYVQRL